MKIKSIIFPLQQNSFHFFFNLKANGRSFINEGEFFKLNFSYQDRGFYFRQIQRFIDFFPRKNMMFLLFENFIRDQEKYVSEILRFIDLKINHLDIGYNLKSNPAFRPRFQLLNKIIYRDTILNRTAKKIIRNEAFIF